MSESLLRMLVVVPFPYSGLGRVWSALVSRRRVVHSAHELQSWPVAESKLMPKYGRYSLAVAIRVCVDAL